MQELLHQPCFPSLCQHVEGESITFVQERFDSSVLRDGNGDARWSETRLADPTGHHRTTEFTLAGGQHAKRTENPAEGNDSRVAATFAEPTATATLGSFLRLEQLTSEAGSGFLQLFNLG